MAVDPIQQLIGSFGRQQFWLCAVIFVSKFPIAFHQMAIIFLAPKVNYTCEDTEEATCPCESPQYDTSIFSRTIVMEWDLICGKRSMVSLAQMFFQLGTLVGSVLFGMAADRFGRKKPFLFAVVLQLTTGVAAAFAPEYWTFSILRLLTGTSVGGTMVCGFVIIMEFVGTRHREVVSALYQVPFNMGHLMLPLFGYFLRDYTHFQLAISLTAVLMLSYFWWVPETPRWLIAVHRTEEAIKILEKVAKQNKLPTAPIRPEIEAFHAAKSAEEHKKGSVLDLFRTPNIRRNILAMSLNWLTCSYCFYGVSQYVGQLSGNIFLNVASSACVTLLGTLCSIPLLRVLGRRALIIIFHSVCCTCLVILAAIPAGAASVVLASVGVVSSFIVFVVVYLYCSELFPTVVRNAAIGVSSMSARIGSMVAPFVIDLQQLAPWAPPLVFALLPAAAAIVSLVLPETKGCELLSTIEEAERFGGRSALNLPNNNRPVDKSKVTK